MALKVTFALLAVLVAFASAKAPLLGPGSSTIIENEYIVVMKEELSDQEVGAHKTMVRSAMQLSGNFSQIRREYNIGKGFRGYSVVADPKVLDTIRSMSAVKYVEHNQEVHAFQGECILQKPAEWGLHRTVDRDIIPEEEYYEYHKEVAGAGVDVYIIDTGIYMQHTEFEDRAKWGYDSVDTPSPQNDPNGHGTHVAGTVAGKTYGLARKASVIAVRVLNAFGSGTYEGVIAGVEYVASEHKPEKKSVANMSLGGGKSETMNNAVDAAIDKGVHFAIAAGNENQDACNVSPASSQSITVAATDDRDYRSYFSNWGTCVEIFAPGSGIQSAYIGSPTATATLSGTSMAAPHVAGVMAKLLTVYDFPPTQMLVELQNRATKDIVLDPGFGTPNLLLYHSCFDNDSPIHE